MITKNNSWSDACRKILRESTAPPYHLIFSAFRLVVCALTLTVVFGSTSGIESHAASGSDAQESTLACSLPGRPNFFRYSGTDDANALQINPYIDKAIQIQLEKGKSRCVLTFDAESKELITFSLHQLNGGMPDGTVRLSLYKSETEGSSLLVSSNIATKNTVVESGKYYLVLQQPKTLGTSIQSYELDIRQPINLDAAPLQMQPGAALTITLSSGAYHSAFFKFALERRSALRFRITGHVEIDSSIATGRVELLIRNRKLNLTYYADNSVEAPGAEAFGFILPPGEYEGELDVRWNEYPNPALAAGDLRDQLVVEEVSEAKIPDQLISFDKWLHEVGLSRHFEVVRVTDFHIALANGDPFAKDFNEQRNELLEEAKPSPSASIQILPEPKIVVSLRSHLGHGEIEPFEENFEKRTGTSLWSRIVQKIAFANNLRASDIMVEVPIECDAGLVYESAPGVIYRHGMECMSATFGETIPDDLSGFFQAASTQLGTTNFETTVQDFLTKIAGSSANIEFNERSAGYVEAILGGMKGRVIQGGQQWERLQIEFIISGNSKLRTVRVIVDGMLANALGMSPPPVSQFTESMEPQYSEQLTSFTKSLTDQYVTFAKARGHT